MDFVNSTTSQQNASSVGMDNGNNPDDWLDIAFGIAGPQDDWFLNMDGGDTSLFFTEDKILSTKVEKMGMHGMQKTSLLRSAFSTGDLQSLEVPSDFSPRWAPLNASSRRLESVPENATSNGGPLVNGPHPVTLATPQPRPSFHDPNTGPAFQEPQNSRMQNANGTDPLSDPLQNLSIEQLEAQLSIAQQQGGMPNGGMQRGGYSLSRGAFMGNDQVSFPPPMPQGGGPAPSMPPGSSQAPPSFPQIKQSSSSQDLMALGPMQSSMSQSGGGMYGMMPPQMGQPQMGQQQQQQQQGNSGVDSNGGMGSMQMPFMMQGPHGSVMPPQAFHAYSALMNPAAPLPSNPSMPSQQPSAQSIPNIPNLNNLSQAPHQPLLPPLTVASLQSPTHQQQHSLPQQQSQQQQQQQQQQPGGMQHAPPPSPIPPFSQPQASPLSSNGTMEFSQSLAVSRPASVTTFSSMPMPSHQMNDLSHTPSDQGLTISTAQIPPHQQQLLPSPHQPSLGSTDSLAHRGLRKSQSCVELASWRSQSSLDMIDLVQPAVPGKLTPEERAAKLFRYRQKRNERNFNRTIKYQCRKTLADTRPRVRGRFARNNDPDSVPPELTKKALREKAKHKPGSGVKLERLEGSHGLGNPGDGSRMLMGNGAQNSSSHTTTTSTDDSLDIPSLSDPMAMLVDSAASSATSAFDYITSATSTQMMAQASTHMYPTFAHYQPNQPTT